MRYIPLIILLIVSIYGEAQPVPISSLKKMRRDTLNVVPESNRKYMVNGYLYKDPTPLLINDTAWMYANTRIPDTSYLLLAAVYPNIKLQLDSIANGSFLEIGGYLNEKSNSRSSADFRIRDVFNVRRRANRAAVPTTAKCPDFPRMCTVSVPASDNYALLYSGGIDTVNAHIRYWNNLKFMYQTLQSMYGYQSDHIIVVYKSGRPEDPEMKVDYPATKQGLDAAFGRLSEHVREQNDLVIYMTNHGGGFNEDSGKNYEGVKDKVPYDEVDKYRLDEVSYYYEPQPDLDYDNDLVPDDEWADKINRLHFHKLVGIFQQCFSGGFLRDLRGDNRIVLSAANEFEFSWSDYDQRYDIFSYFFISALNQATPTGATVKNADTNHDGKISILEAFSWARDQDHIYLKKAGVRETPQLEDNGDGVSSNQPKAVKGRDGWLADQTFLK